MAMYYQGSSEIQADGLQTLYLMNPNYVGYSDPQHPPQSNLLYLNSASSSSTLMPHAPLLPQAQQFVGFPLSHDLSRPSPVPGEEIPRFHYNRWGLDNQTNMAPQTPRGLSLTLSAHQTGLDKPISGDQYFPVPMISSKNCSSPPLTVTDQSNGVNCTMRSVLIGSKYLKAAQELLEEVANVGKDTTTDRKEPSKDKAKMNKDSIVKDTVSIRDCESGGKEGGTDLTTAQKQEIQMKKAKLNSMLDEVEQRCRQYHNQMQIVVASFEEAAGVGSARTYTQLALKTILKQFKCLKSTISAQIKALNKNLGEEEGLEKKLLEGSRLKFVDHLQIRQQRALQQMGIMQNNNAWRPQRGLPEKAVSILRAWLFQHFLHPYPKDSDKQMLAKQTGLTRSQVSNWFINARVRLWKPMVEEMYLEETKNQQQITSHGNSTKQETKTKTATADPSSRGGFGQLITSMNTETLPEKNPQNGQQGASPGSILSAEMEIKAGETTDNYLSMAAANVNTYGISELDTSAFQGNSFSLTLGLPPTETDFLSRRNFEFGARIESGNGETGRVNQAAAAHQSIGYEILDFQNRKPFPAQLLPDFVA